MAGVDYSKWDKLDVDEDGEVQSKASAEAPAPAPKKKKKPVPTAICMSCRAEGAKLRCTVCKKATYCSRNCQKSDWRFHRRTCKKPAKKKTTPSKPSKPAASGGGSGSGSSSSSGSKAAAPAPAPKPKPAKKKQSPEPTQAELDAEDEEIVKSLKGYRYFHRDITDHEAKLIGDTTPELLESKASNDDPVPVQHSKITSSSAWNTAGTWEERDMTKWAKGHLTDLLVGITQEVTDGHIAVKELSDWEGDASIPVIRGKPRFLYDFTFKAKLELNAVGSSAAKKAEVKFIDFSNDEDEHEVELTFVSPKPSQLHQAAIRSVMERPGGLLFAKLNTALEQFVVDFKAK